MKPSKNHIDELKFILENIRTPARLNDHPWVKSLVVREGVANDNSLSQKNPGYQLIAVLSKLFRQMMPSTPPRQGKRLDTRWCQFGMLAAQYFAPFIYGMAYPPSLRDAWGKIDQAILLFVSGEPGSVLPEMKRSPYRLTEDEAEPAPNSTLSDWHIKGLQRFAELILNHEQYLSNFFLQPPVILQPSHSKATNIKNKIGDTPSHSFGPAAQVNVGAHRSRWYRRYGCLLPIILAFIVLLLLGAKGWRIYQRVQCVQKDMEQLQSLMDAYPNFVSIDTAGPLLSGTRRDVAALRSEVEPLLWLSPWASWLPVYGGDLAAAGPLLDMSAQLTIAVDEAYQGLLPFWQAIHTEKSQPNLSEITRLLVEAQPRLTVAKSALDEALAIRRGIDTQQLSPYVRDLIEERIDPYMQLLDNGLPVAVIFPKMMGATSDGPQTYLLLLQNEDELRPTGGFITAVGVFVVNDGNILSFTIENSSDLDDFTKPFPFPPWQLYRYMNSHYWVLRDSNWSPDFPTSANAAEYFYVYTRFHSVDGIVAIDQQMVKMLLTVLGPLDVEGVSYPITAENVVAYMQDEKDKAQHEGRENQKDFIKKLGEAILAEITNPDATWTSLLEVLTQALDERHMLLQFDDPAITAILANMGWDGAVRPGEGDFLMVVDSNVGFDKVNAVVDKRLVYFIDLSDLAAPTASLTVIHTNNASNNAPCIQWLESRGDTYNDLFEHCYWNYLRVYKPAGTQLLDATPHAVPGTWAIRGEDVPARVDILDDENINGVQGFGTLLVVPGGTSLETNFGFLLPSRILVTTGKPGLMTYQLRVQKQPGTLAIPLVIRVRLPAGALLINASPEARLVEGDWVFDTDLRTDVEIVLTFQNH